MWKGSWPKGAYLEMCSAILNQKASYILEGLVLTSTKFLIKWLLIKKRVLVKLMKLICNLSFYKKFLTQNLNRKYPTLPKERKSPKIFVGKKVKMVGR